MSVSRCSWWRMTISRHGLRLLIKVWPRCVGCLTLPGCRSPPDLCQSKILMISAVLVLLGLRPKYHESSVRVILHNLACLMIITMLRQATSDSVEWSVGDCEGVEVTWGEPCWEEGGCRRQYKVPWGQSAGPPLHTHHLPASFSL